MARFRILFSVLLSFVCFVSISLFHAENSEAQSPPTGSGHPICGDPANQNNPRIAPIGSGEAMVVWEDSRNGEKDIYAQKVGSHGQIVGPELEICKFSGRQEVPKIVTDGLGGAIIVWYDGRDPQRIRLYAQKVDGNGNVAWGTNGRSVVDCESYWFEQLWYDIASDLQGGVVVAYMVRKDNPDSALVYAQKVDASGQCLWNNPKIIANNTDRCYSPKCVSDRNGGVYITWFDGNGNLGVSAQHVNANGDLWSGPTSVVDAAGVQTHNYLTTNMDGDLIAWWQDDRQGTWDIYAQKIDKSGNYKWTLNGVEICTAPSTQCIGDPVHALRCIEHDGYGGAIIVWEDYRDSGATGADIYAQRIDVNRNVMWGTNGRAICSSTGNQGYPQVALDGVGGVDIAWQDMRSGTYDIYYQKVSIGNGSPIYATNGVPVVCEASSDQKYPQLIDYQGNVRIVWEDNRKGNWDIYCNAISRAPSLSWSSEPGYGSDGVNPNKGVPGNLFEFRVVYRDADNDPPSPGYPKLCLDSDNDGDCGDENEGEYSMIPLSSGSDFAQGKEYYCSIALPTGDYEYKFSAQDTSGLVAQGPPTAWSDNLTVGNFPDLVITASDIRYSNPNPSPNDVFIVSANITNDSDVPVSDVMVRTSILGGAPIDEQAIAQILPHGTAAVEFPYSFANAGYYVIKVSIDPNNAITEEWNKENNNATRPISVGSTAPASISIENVPSELHVLSGYRISFSGHAVYKGTATPAETPVLGAPVALKPTWTPDESATRTNDYGNFSASITAPIATGNYQIGVTVTDYTLRGDTTILVQVDPLPDDLHGPDLVIYVSASRPCVGGSSEIQWSVQNIGDRESSETTAKLLVNGTTVLAVENVPPLQGGQLHPLDPVPYSPIEERSAATGIVDPDNSIPEIREFNNSSTALIEPFPLCVDLKPDYPISSTSSPGAGETVSFMLRVCNQGCINSQPSSVSFIIDGAENNSSNLDPIPGMGGCAIVSFDYTFVDASSHRFTFVVDPSNNNPEECDENNNSTYIDISAKLPDLEMRTEWIDTTGCHCANSDCVVDTAKVKIGNRGNHEARDVRVGLTVRDVPPSSYMKVLDRLRANSDTTIYFRISWVIPIDSPTVHVFEVCADPEGCIQEERKDNNCATRSFDFRPVSTALAAFYASSELDGIGLQWKMSSEFASCSLDRSICGTNDWKTITTDPIVQESSGGYKEYTYIDRSVEVHVNYEYRIVAYNNSEAPHVLGSVKVTYDTKVPGRVELLPNYPNPFNPVTSIVFALPERQNVSLVIYDVGGRLIRELFSGVLPAGYHNFSWNGQDNQGNQVSSGVYFHRLEARGHNQTRKMILLK